MAGHKALAAALLATSCGDAVPFFSAAMEGGGHAGYRTAARPTSNPARDNCTAQSDGAAPTAQHHHADAALAQHADGLRQAAAEDEHRLSPLEAAERAAFNHRCRNRFSSRGSSLRLLWLAAFSLRPGAPPFASKACAKAPGTPGHRANPCGSRP